IGHANNLSKDFYSKEIQSCPFTFYKNRIIIPVQIGNKSFPFMYDCGASLYTLQTTPGNAKTFMPAVYSDTLFNINNGESGQVHNVAGGKINKKVQLLGKVYKDLLVYVEKGESAIFNEAKVAGILGNKLFLDHIIAIDFKERKFTWLE
uniref:hypothetical protein n=1 Tax=Mucilaginibacter sp. TaxID=1882438 RepID=UPI0035BBDE4F